MGGRGNSLDRARLLAALLEYSGHTARIVQSSTTRVTYPATTPPSLATVSPNVLIDLEKLVQREGPKLYRRLCQSQQACVDWPQQPRAKTQAFWVQVNGPQGWRDLVPADTRADNQARSAATTLSADQLKGLSWSVRIEVSNTYGNGSPKRILRVEMPAARLHARAITFDNLPQTSGFMPVLSIDGGAPHSGEFFTLAGSGGALSYQQLAVEIRGPGISRRHTRLLATPNPQVPGLEMVTRARITISTGPLWTGYSEYLQTRTMDRLANMLYAPDEERDPSPTNFNSFRALSFLSLSRRFAGQVGQAGRQSHVYQGSPTVIVERLTASGEAGHQVLLSNFDLMDMGNAVYCDDCSLDQRRQAAVEQGLVDGYLEDAMLRSYQGTSSHHLSAGLIRSGSRLSNRAPRGAVWQDTYNRKNAGYRLGTVEQQLVGWRLSPGPQITPLLESGAGGAGGQVMASVAPSSGARAGTSGAMPSGGGRIYNPFSGGVSGFVTNMIRHATTKCGASDIGGSIILALAGAPMTAPLLSGIVGHMCRTAEAYNKAAMALNCLEFMGNDCSAEQHASDLEKMLRGLGRELGIDLALAQAMDILFGMAIDGVIAPAVRNWIKKWRGKTPRQKARAKGMDIDADGNLVPIKKGPRPGRLPDTGGPGTSTGAGRTPDGDGGSGGAGGRGPDEANGGGSGGRGPDEANGGAGGRSQDNGGGAGGGGRSQDNGGGPGRTQDNGGGAGGGGRSQDNGGGPGRSQDNGGGSGGRGPDDANGGGSGTGRTPDGDDAGSGTGRAPDGEDTGGGPKKGEEDSGPPQVDEFTMDDFLEGTGRSPDGDDAGSGTGRTPDGDEPGSTTGRTPDGEDGPGGKKTDELDEATQEYLRQLEKNVGDDTGIELRGRDAGENPASRPPEDRIRVGDRTIPNQPGMSPERVKAIQDGQIPVNRGETWNGALEHGRMVAGPSNLELGNELSHEAMGVPRGQPKATRQGFTVYRDSTGKITVIGSGGQGNTLSPRDKAVVERMVQKWVDESGS
jgi:hypothetical protein